MTKKLLVKLLKDDAVLPEYQTPGAAGMDLIACLDKPVTLKPGERQIISTGICIELPIGYEAQIRARSGLAAKHGVGLANGIGTIDSDYRGEIGVILINLGQEDFTISSGDRIAQMVIARYEVIEIEVVTELSSSKRSDGGFGSTGHKNKK